MTLACGVVGNGSAPRSEKRRWALSICATAAGRSPAARALFGGYGAYFTTAQLFSDYVTLDRHFDPAAGGLLAALIALAGIPGSLLGGYGADRSPNLRMFVVGPLVVVAALLALIPVVPARVLWGLGIGIGFFLIFGFAAWLAVPAGSVTSSTSTSARRPV